MNSDIYKKLYRAKEFIDDCYDLKIDLAQMAKQACLSEFHFLRLFHKVYNKTPHKYLIQRRLDKARELLKTDSLSITEVCFDVGFESLGSFSSLFAKQVGATPSEFRRESARKMFLSVFHPEKLVPGCFMLIYSR